MNRNTPEGISITRVWLGPLDRDDKVMVAVAVLQADRHIRDYWLLNEFVEYYNHDNPYISEFSIQLLTPGSLVDGGFTMKDVEGMKSPCMISAEGCVPSYIIESQESKVEYTRIVLERFEKEVRI